MVFLRICDDNDLRDEYEDSFLFGPYVSFFRARKKLDEEEGKVKK